MTDLHRHRLFRRFSQLTLTIVGQSTDSQIIQPMGSAFFIAPYTAVTAKHIVDSLWDELRMHWERGKYPKGVVENAFFAVLSHAPDADYPDDLARWQATSAVKSRYTDIAVMNLVPVNPTAEQLVWPSFADLMLTPPEIGSEIAAYGFPDVSQEKLSDDRSRVSATSRLANGSVVALWEAGRGSFNFPHFETDAELDHGMSGGPVMCNGSICGVVSYGRTSEDGATASFAAALWPLLLDEMETSVDPRESIPVASMIETGHVRAPGWRSLRKRVTSDRDANGRPVARLQPL